MHCQSYRSTKEVDFITLAVFGAFFRGKIIHVETVTLFPQRESKDETVVSFENKKATKAETKPTYDQIKEYVMEKYGVKVSSLDVANAKTNLD